MVMGEREMCGFTQLFLILSFYLSKKKRREMCGRRSSNGVLGES